MTSEVELERIQIKDLTELRTFWERVLKLYFGPRTLCLLIGPLGSGKTESLKQICEIGKFKDVASPSFAIHHRTSNSEGKILDHVDLYRLNSSEELEGTGFWDLFEASESWIFVEWGDLVESESWPLHWPTLLVKIEISNGSNRVLTVSRLIRS